MSITFIIVSIRDKHSWISQATTDSLGFLTFILRFMELIKSQAAVIIELIISHFFILQVSQGFFSIINLIYLSSKQQGSFSKVGVNVIMSFGSSSQLPFRITAQNVFFFSKNIWSLCMMRSSLNMYFSTEDHHDLQVSFILLGCLPITTLPLGREAKFCFIFWTIHLCCSEEPEPICLNIYFAQHSYLHITQCSQQTWLFVLSIDILQ